MRGIAFILVPVMALAGFAVAKADDPAAPRPDQTCGVSV